MQFEKWLLLTIDDDFANQFSLRNMPMSTAGIDKKENLPSTLPNMCLNGCISFCKKKRKL